MSKIVASLVINKCTIDGIVSTGLAKIELDASRNLDADGKPGNTNFQPGDTVYFLVHHDSTLVLNYIRSTCGVNPVSLGNVTQERIDQLLWVMVDDTHELSYVPSNTPIPTWFGNEATNMRIIEGERGVGISGLGHPALCDASYIVGFKSFKIVTPDMTLEDDETYPITIVAYMGDA